jgi:hypothetical protein
LNVAPWLLFIANIQASLKLAPSVNGATWDVVPHALKRHGTTKVLAFNGYGARGCLVPQLWSTLMGVLALIAPNVVEISLWADLHVAFEGTTMQALHRSHKIHTVKSCKCIKNPLYIVLVLC